MPVVDIAYGRSLEVSNIKEGDDVYMECSVTARPPITPTVKWFHNVSQLYFPCYLPQIHVCQTCSKAGLQEIVNEILIL